MRVFLANPKDLGGGMNGANDVRFMKIAVEEARRGAQSGEIPIGAVLVRGDKVIAKNHNRCITDTDPTAHAEILVIRGASRKIGNYRLPGSVLYVTVEPCTMCVGAMIQARISRLVFGVCEEKTGVVQSRLALLDRVKFNHRIETVGGVLAEECRDLIQGFFKTRREENRQTSAFLLY
jgi:tRNA(adenine34) deaminase